MKIRFTCILVLAAAFYLQGCAVGNRYNFSGVSIDVKSAPKQHTAVAVGALDKRKHIVSGRCGPTYVGMQRGGYGNPFRVNTESGLPFSDDMVNVISQSLNRNGYAATPVTISHDKTIQDAQAALAKTGAERLLFVIIKKWETDTYTNIGLDYELDLKVLDSKQHVLAEKTGTETKTISGSFWNPPAEAKMQAPLALKAALENLLNDQKVLAVLDTENPVNFADTSPSSLKNADVKSLDDLKVELKKIQGLKAEGLITGDEYKKMKAKIIDKM